MDDKTLRKRLIRLAYEKPELRKEILPLLRVAMEHATDDARKKYLQDHRNADPKNHTVKKTEGDGGEKDEGGKEKGGGGKKLKKPKREHSWQGNDPGEHWVTTPGHFKAISPEGKAKGFDSEDAAEAHSQGVSVEKWKAGRRDRIDQWKKEKKPSQSYENWWYGERNKRNKARYE